MNCTEHDDDAPDGEPNEHDPGANEPPPDCPKVTVPDGATFVPSNTSVTVAVHVDGVPATTDPGEHDTDVEVNRERIRFDTEPDADPACTDVCPTDADTA